MHFTISAFLLGAFGALIVEVLRIKTVVDKLFDDMNSAGWDPNLSNKVRYPRYYFLSVLIYAATAGLLACTFPPETNPLLLIYAGLAMPKLVAWIVEKGGTLLPGNSPSVSNKNSGTPDVSVDDTSIGIERAKPLRRVGRGKYRRANDLYFYLAG